MTNLNVIRQHPLEAALATSFLDQNKLSDSTYTAKVITNIPDKSNVWSYIKDGFEHCQSFMITAAFITPSILPKFKAVLADLKDKGVSGRLLTSAYLMFNSPEVFRELNKIHNLEVRVAPEAARLHAKCYYFNNGDHKTAIIGSSNLTQGAMFNNDEWNVRFSFLEKSSMNEQLQASFDRTWGMASPLTNEWIKQYKQAYIIKERANQQVQQTIEKAEEIKPNTMQLEAIAEIMDIKERKQQDKALLISATGTGKTYLGAFVTKKIKPNRFLFIVHRQEILTKARQSFMKILGGKAEDFAIYSGSNNDMKAVEAARFVFASEQMIGSKTHITDFAKDAFDLLLIDEVHHAGDNTYQRIINYFEPKFMLGMTATPERNDDYNIFELFDFNIAYEIRLHQAIEEGLLVPFQYIGISDYTYANEDEILAQINSKRTGKKELKHLRERYSLEFLATQERAKYIIEQSNFYGYSGEKLHGLIFCSSVTEAKKLAEILTEQGHSSVALSGSDSNEKRQMAIKAFEAGQYEYILTVDIFNEGIDIPMVNQVIFLRSTQSNIVFIQQLGRGLRKYPGKEFLVVIDFIGNYDVNYMTPFILTGDNSGSPSNGRKILKTTELIGKASGITFREIPRQKISDALEKSKARLNDMTALKKQFRFLKSRMPEGKYPMLMDFCQADSLKPMAFTDKNQNYYEFIKKQIKSNTDICLPEISEYQFDVLTLVMQELMNGKRQHELLLLKALVTTQTLSREEYITLLGKNSCYINDLTLRSVQRVLDWSFFKKNKEAIVSYKNGFYSLNPDLLNNKTFIKFFLDEIEAGLFEAKNYASNQVLTINRRYGRKDFCRLMGWETNMESTIYGYKTNQTLKQIPIFVTYHKDDDIEDDIKYDEYFESTNIFHWSARKNTTLSSKDVKEILNPDFTKYLFIKKTDLEKSQFIYLGEVNVIPDTAENTSKEGINYAQLDFSLTHELSPNQYKYFVGKVD